MRCMATAEELRKTYAWMEKLENDGDVTSIKLAQPGTELKDGDEYVDATSPKRGRVLSMEGETVPKGGVYIVKSETDGGLWDRIGTAIR
jgi:hypothetical protein